MSSKTPSDNDKGSADNVTPIKDRRANPGFDSEIYMERLANTFESSAHRWEIIVYPSLLAFVVLAGIGFFLVYSLTTDVASLARNVNLLTQSMNGVVVSMSDIAVHMKGISNDVNLMSYQMNNLEPMRASMDNMNASMNSMSASTHGMAISTDAMRQHMGALNYNVGKPMSMFNSFMPW